MRPCPSSRRSLRLLLGVCPHGGAEPLGVGRILGHHLEPGAALHVLHARGGIIIPPLPCMWPCPIIRLPPDSPALHRPCIPRSGPHIPARVVVVVHVRHRANPLRQLVHGTRVGRKDESLALGGVLRGIRDPRHAYRAVQGHPGTARRARGRRGVPARQLKRRPSRPSATRHNSMQQQQVRSESRSHGQTSDTKMRVRRLLDTAKYGHPDRAPGTDTS
jgi:hypothetical protein